MQALRINRPSGVVVLLLSLTALLAVLGGYTQPPQSDEGALAHLFQLSIVALVPVIVLFVRQLRLEAAFEKRAAAGHFGRHVGARVRRAVLPRALSLTPCTAIPGNSTSGSGRRAPRAERTIRS